MDPAHSIRRLAAGLLLVVCGLFVAGCSSLEAGDAGRLAQDAAQDVQRKGSDLLSGESTSASGTRVVTVERIVDGDTIEISPDAAGSDTVRFLAVDTPETYNGTEPLGSQAKAFTSRQLEGEEVRLEYDEEKNDPYGRTLAHVRVVGEQRTIQQKLLSNGLAQTAWYEPNFRYQTQLEAIQETARQSQAGIWGLPVSERCQLANHSNSIGENSPECEAA